MGSLLAQIMQAASNAAPNVSMPNFDKNTSEDKIGKENRDAWRKRVQTYIDDGDYNSAVAMMKGAPSGINTEMYETQLQNPGAQSEIGNTFGQLIKGLFAQPQGETPTKTQPQQGAMPTDNNALPGMPTTQQPSIFNAPTESAPPLPQSDNSIRGISPSTMQDIAVRGAIKKYSGVDVGAHYFEAPSWFQHYGELVQKGTPIEKAVSDTATRFGFIPDGASNLKGLPDTDRKILFEQEFSKILSDPIFDQAIRQHVPPNIDATKYKAGFALDFLAKQGRYIPESHQGLLDRFRGFDDPKFLDNETQRWIWENYRIKPADVTPDISAKARKEMDDYNFLKANKQAYHQMSGTTQAQHDAELSTPIKAEDRAKHGIGSQIKTYAELADEGKRFASEGERKMYNDWIALRNLLTGMDKELFDAKSGIFTGIKTPLNSRVAARGGLLYDKAAGNPRGVNYEYYNDVLASYARRLIAAAGETGGRYTDRDVIQIMSGAPDSGHGMLGIPDSEDLAKKKFDRYIYEVTRMIHNMEATTTIQPSGQASKTSANQSGQIKLKDGTIIESQSTYDEMLTTPEGKATIKAHGGLVSEDLDAAANELINKYKKR